MGANKSRSVQPPSVADDENPILHRDYNGTEYAAAFTDAKCSDILQLDHTHSSTLTVCKASLLDRQGNQVLSGRLELTVSEIIYHFKKKEAFNQMKWQLAGIRSYGFSEHIFTFEAGRRCQLGGIFFFKCKKAQVFMNLLSEQVRWLKVQGPSILENSTRSKSVPEPIPRLPSSSLSSSQNALKLWQNTLTSSLFQPDLISCRGFNDDTNRDEIESSSYVPLSIPTSVSSSANVATRMAALTAYQLLANRLTPNFATRPDDYIRLCCGSAGPKSSTGSICGGVGGGVYVFAAPDPPLPHSYENQHTMIGSYYGENTSTACS